MIFRRILLVAALVPALAPGGGTDVAKIVKDIGLKLD